MPLRFYRRFRAGPFRLNLVSNSFGGRHAWLTLGHGRVRTSIGIPGTGLHWYREHRLPRRSSTPLVRDNYRINQEMSPRLAALIKKAKRGGPVDMIA
jgi:hypothetical protein